MKTCLGLIILATLALGTAWYLETNAMNFLILAASVIISWTDPNPPEIQVTHYTLHMGIEPDPDDATDSGLYDLGAGQTAANRRADGRHDLLFQDPSPQRDRRFDLLRRVGLGGCGLGGPKPDSDSPTDTRAIAATNPYPGAHSLTHASAYAGADASADTDARADARSCPASAKAGGKIILSISNHAGARNNSSQGTN